jgi:hypothetical protein
LLLLVLLYLIAHRAHQLAWLNCVGICDCRNGPIRLLLLCHSAIQTVGGKSEKGQQFVQAFAHILVEGEQNDWGNCVQKDGNL